jgi:Coenzyme PQQ synthesis protein D (PqqD)
MRLTDTYVAKSPTIASRHLGDETIIMSTIDSTLFSLNPTGTAIWEAADGNTPLSSIIEQKVCTAFDVSVEQAHTDAMEFIGRLVEHGILVVSTQPIQQ